MTVTWLASDEGQAVIESLRGVDPLQARGLFPALSTEQITAALTQAKHKPTNFPLRVVTPDGVQQATPVAVATRRATRLARSVDRVIDAGCGIGMDAWAFTQAGLEVLAYEHDQQTAQIARANGIEVITADVTSSDLPDIPLYVDPARRKRHAQADGQPIRVHDPHAWQPPFDWVLRHASLARVAPGLREIPPGTEWHCSSMDRTLVDATIWFAPLAAVDRRASVYHRGVWHELIGPAAARVAGPVSEYLVDPDPAIVRSGLVTNTAGTLIDPALAFVTFDQRPPAWFGRAMRVVEEVPFRAVKQACAGRRMTVWARGFPRVPDLGITHGMDGVVAVARVGPARKPRAWIGEVLH